LNLDTATRSLHMVGKGSDATGTSAASMDLTAAVQATGDTCELAGKSEVTMSGKAASLGGRLMGPVADQMLKQFVANFAARLQARQAQQTEATGEGADTAGATASASSAGDASASSAASADTVTAMPAAALGAVPAATAATTAATGAAKAATAPSARSATMPEPTAPPAELNGLAMAWAILRDWLRGLFSRKTV
jgi:hypothetical protein